MARQFTKEQFKKLPKYVSLEGGTFLRLYNPEHNKFPGWREYYVEYFRDGGLWSVDIRIAKDGKLYSKSVVKLVNNIELKPATYKEWRKSNGRYVTDETKAHNK